MTKLFVFLYLLVFTGICRSASPKYDWSLESFCNYYQGTFVQRDNDYKPGVGDRCEKLRFQYATGDPILARKFCEEMVPHHITRAVVDDDDYYTVCDAETGLICEDGWIQLYGRCYKMEKKLYTRSDADARCKAMDGAAYVAFMHRNIMAVHWSDYYSGVSRIWMEASDVIKNDLVYDKGPDMMLVFDGMFYGVKSLSMIRVDGKTEKAMVLCEYTPQMTREESAYLVRRYSEIYYPGFTTNEGMYVRTASHLILNAQDTRSDENYCQKMMAPFISTIGHRFSGAYPSEAFLEGMASVKKPNVMAYYRTPARFKARGLHRRKEVRCQSTEAKDPSKGFFIELRQPDTRPAIISNIWKSGEPVMKCDAGYWSTAIRTTPDKTALKMETFSDFRNAPMYCQANFGKYRYGDCPDGFTPYQRNTGVKWCHKLHTETKTHPESEAICVAENSHLDGFDTYEEFLFMKKMVTDSPVNCQRTRLGAQRRSECNWSRANQPKHGLGYDPNPEGECARRNVFKWDHSVAGDPPNVLDENWTVDYEAANPSYLLKNRDEKCLEHVKNNGINDFDCAGLTCFWCGQEAPKMGG